MMRPEQIPSRIECPPGSGTFVPILRKGLSAYPKQPVLLLVSGGMRLQEDAMKKFILTLMILSLSGAAFGKEVAVLSELTNPKKIEMNGEHIFILDGFTVFAYSLKDFKLSFQFGKQGAGPGELLDNPDYPVVMQKHAKGILLYSFNKMIWYDHKGAMIKEKRIPYFAFQVIPIEGNMVVSKFKRNSNGGSEIQLLLVDQDFKTLKKICSTVLLNNQGAGKIAYPFSSLIVRVHKGKIYVVDQQKNFEIGVYSSNGSLIKTIVMEYQKIKITPDYKKMKREWFKMQPAFKLAGPRIQEMIYFLEYLPGIKNYQIQGDAIFVETNRVKEGLTEFYQLDLEGKVKRRLWLPDFKEDELLMNPQTNFTFNDKSYYYVKDNFAEETWELHRIELERKEGEGPGAKG